MSFWQPQVSNCRGKGLTLLGLGSHLSKLHIKESWTSQNPGPLCRYLFCPFLRREHLERWTPIPSNLSVIYSFHLILRSTTISDTFLLPALYPLLQCPPPPRQKLLFEEFGRYRRLSRKRFVTLHRKQSDWEGRIEGVDLCLQRNPWRGTTRSRHPKGSRLSRPGWGGWRVGGRGYQKKWLSCNIKTIQEQQTTEEPSRGRDNLYS